MYEIKDIPHGPMKKREVAGSSLRWIPITRLLGWPGRYINVHCFVGLPMVMQLRDT